MVQIKYSDEFLNIFHDGINNYLAGQWKNAKRCLNTTKVTYNVNLFYRK